MENINLKIKKSIVLEVVKNLMIIYAIFLFVLGILINNTELILQIIIMLVVSIIFKYINEEKIQIREDKIYSNKYIDIKYNEIKNFKFKNNIMYIEKYNTKKILKIYLSKNSKIETKKANRYIMSKLDLEYTNN